MTLGSAGGKTASKAGKPRPTRIDGALRQAVKACVPCLSASSVIGGRPRVFGADGPPLLDVAGRLEASIWPVACGCSRCCQLPESRRGGTVKLTRVLGSA